MANQKLAATTNERWRGLLASDAVSRQDADQKSGDLAAKTSLVHSAQANVRRLEALASFKRIRAPFAGIVTSRKADIGQLVTEGATGGPPLFTVADEQRLRVYVQVPQAYAAQIRPGMPATLRVPEHPERTFAARLVSTSRAINAQTGALTAELWITNSDHALTPGSYAQVQFPLPAIAGTVRVPASALITRHDGLSVAVLERGNRVQLRRINVVRDLGAAVEAASGVAATDQVVDNPPDTLQPGDLVRVAGASGPRRKGGARG